MAEQGTEAWYAERLGKVSASRIADVMMKPTMAGYENYLTQLVCERLTGERDEGFQSAAMARGSETEPRARAFYEFETGLVVQEVGFVDHPTLAMAGASPDGLVGPDGLVEIKCPTPKTHLKSLRGGKIDRKYLLQMHWQMECTGRDWCDFVSFSPAFPYEMQMCRTRVEKDAELACEITEAVTRFLAAIDAELAGLSQRYRSAA